MMRSTILSIVFALAGCGTPADDARVAEDAHEHAHDDHDHAAVGPNGGSIIELGEHHAELVHDDAAGTVTVYILDGAAAANVPVDATEATINITHGDAADQFKLAASPLRSESDGKSSRFVSSDATLGKALDLEDAVAVFVVTIDGTQHRGNIVHDHAGHDHAH